MALAASVFSQANIAEARTYAVGATVTVTGIVTNAGELGTIRYIQDATAGIGIYDSDVTYFQPGDNVTVTGTMDNYNQLLEIKDITSHSVNSQGNVQPDPQVIMIPEIGEAYESRSSA